MKNMRYMLIATVVCAPGLFTVEAYAAERFLVKDDKRHGYWRGSMLLVREKTLAAAGRNDEALATYRKVLPDNSVIPQHREAARCAIKSVEEAGRQ